MSDYIVYEKIPCPNTTFCCTRGDVCTICHGLGYNYKEVDLAKAIEDVLRTNSVAYIADRIKCYL
jgi:uncharacterized surface anchored protein